MFRLLFLLLFLSTFGVVHAEIFTVSSQLDGGPGTFREALEKAGANGSAETDYIHFAATARLVSLKSPLILSSHLVIDGTTLPGAAFGLSDAKVTIETVIPYTDYTERTALKGTAINHLEIYGLSFSNFSAAGRGASPIYIAQGTNITIGAVGKGNIFLTCDYDVYLFKCKTIKVSANWFGIAADKKTAAGPAFGGTLNFRLCDDIMVGGDTKEEGNLWGFRDYGVMISGINPTTQAVEATGEKCIVKNNSFGVESVGVGIGARGYIQDFRNVALINNTFLGSGGFDFKNIYHSGKIQGNRMGIRSDGSKSYVYSTIGLENCSNMIIGGKNPGEENVMANRVSFGPGTPGVSASNCGDILLQRNAIYCISSMPITYKSEKSKVEIPVIKIDEYDNGTLKGTATPDAEIEVFSDGECYQCDAKKYLGSTFADAQGNWKMTIPPNVGFTASATLNNRTSEFLGMSLQMGNYIIKQPTCGQANGSITGIVVQGATAIEWRNAEKKLVGTNADLKGLLPGTYSFTAFLGTACKTQTSTWELKDITPQLYTDLMKIQPATCSLENGGISNVFLSNLETAKTKSVSWLNDADEVKGTALALQNVKGGNYRLKVVTTDDCTVVFGPFNIPAEGAPVADLRKMLTEHADCDRKNGSITGLIASGKGAITFIWRNEKQDIVGAEADLHGVPAGKYTVEVKDQGTCGSLFYSFIIEEKNGITVDDSAYDLRNAGCTTNDGWIKNLKISSSDRLTYRWTNDAGLDVGHQLDVVNLPPGKYKLTVANTYCIKTLEYNIIRQSAKIFPELTYKITDAACGEDSGMITVQTSGIDAGTKLRWTDATGATIGRTNTIMGLKTGKYSLFLTDEKECEQHYKDYTVLRIEPLVMDLAEVNNQADHCAMGLGAISNIMIKGGVAPYQYEWLNDREEVVGRLPILANVPYGFYKLRVTDNSGSSCNFVEKGFVINNIGEEIEAPAVADVKLCSEGEGTIRVLNPVAGNYKLYQFETGGQALMENNTGLFTLEMVKSKSYFLSLANGNCESKRTAVPVTFAEKAVDVPSSFSPNGDGANDTWIIKNIEQYPQAIIKVFNRLGNMVFNSGGYGIPFDGQSNGKILPVGVYYYTIQLATNCKSISGSLMLMR
ncbi:gliding motility-associated C-terminal domain-containing protein [Pedobacter sp. KACC 23697]|uniref:Gliding motility-associated C-terminal domain-containing protein n=1 Tax=Pedobacter sp. KACC 23697 TaxID=3149230 RepID=A0AAU7K1V0_9SPHI